MISMMLFVVSFYVFSRAVEKGVAAGTAMRAMWAVTALVGVFGILYALLTGQPKITP